jgi:hypothetical protein
MPEPVPAVEAFAGVPGAFTPFPPLDGEAATGPLAAVVPPNSPAEPPCANTAGADAASASASPAPRRY